MNLNDRILYEDNQIVVINKISGEIVQGDKTNDIPLLEHVKQYIKHKYNKPGDVFLAVIHRIDRPVSGIVIFARTSKFAARMSEIIKNNQIDKTYLALTYKKPNPESGKLINYIYKNEKQNKSYIVYNNDINNLAKNKLQKAELDYKYLGSSDRYNLIEIKLITGRHHQIRAQLSNIGCVIKGDLKYGAKRSNKDGSISLHAYKVEFVQPITGKHICIVAPIISVDPIWSVFNLNY